MRQLDDSLSVLEEPRTARVEATAEYDANHTRVAKRGPTETTLYMGDLYECTGSSTTDGTITCDQQRFKIYASGKLVTEVARDSFNNDTAKYIHADHLGSATLITSDTGAVAEDRRFDAFGATNANLSTSSIHSGYTGQEHDAELGLINMKGRLYDSNIRRFITPDPFVTQPLNTQGLNRYSYVQNNPINFTDPSGFDECQSDGTGCGSTAMNECMAQGPSSQECAQWFTDLTKAEADAESKASSDAAAEAARTSAQESAAKAAQDKAQAEANQAALQLGYEAQLRGQSQAQANAQAYQSLFNQPTITQPQNMPPGAPNQTADPSRPGGPSSSPSKPPPAFLGWSPGQGGPNSDSGKGQDAWAFGVSVDATGQLWYGGSFGLNLEVTSDAGLGFYFYHPQPTPGSMEGFGAGLSVQVNYATGTGGPWTGTFNNIGFSAGPAAFGMFSTSPYSMSGEGGWAGYSLGISGGVPVGAYTNQTYYR